MANVRTSKKTTSKKTGSKKATKKTGSKKTTSKKASSRKNGTNGAAGQARPAPKEDEAQAAEDKPHHLRIAARLTKTNKTLQKLVANIEVWDPENDELTASITDLKEALSLLNSGIEGIYELPEDFEPKKKSAGGRAKKNLLGKMVAIKEKFIEEYREAEFFEEAAHELCEIVSVGKKKYILKSENGLRSMAPRSHFQLATEEEIKAAKRAVAEAADDEG